MNQGSPPVFIVGMNGSGTTMLLDCLDRHPVLYGFPLETRVMPGLLSAATTFGDLQIDDNFLRAFNHVRRLPVFYQVNESEEVPLPENWNQHDRDMASVFNAVFQYFAQQQGKRRWCEKTPQHVQHIGLLAKNFPGAKFIHIIRDGRDCAVSFQRRWKRTPELTIYRWRKVVGMGCEQGRRISDRYMELKYEDLTADPGKWMPRICEFLDLSFDKNVLVSRRPQSENRGVLGEIEPNVEKWKTALPATKLRSLERIAGKSLSELGYPVESGSVDHDPAGIRIKYWKSRDYARQFFYEVYRKLTGQSRKNWRMLLYLPVSAIKQIRSNRY